MRYAALLILGIAVGAICAGIAVNTLRQRDAYPRGLMQVMQHEYAALRQSTREQHCEIAATDKTFARLRDLATQIEPSVYGSDTPDAPFREYASRMRDALAPAAPADCATLAPRLDTIGNACEACHRQYR